MELTTSQMALIFAGCVLAIGGIVIAWRRGLLGPKGAITPDAASGPAPGEVAK
ncbi:MAG: hypothetical protein J0I06_23115 [Planctomycetes bacterium]|nr:hypothetical protein [Planctomycetota bacterium]